MRTCAYFRPYPVTKARESMDADFATTQSSRPIAASVAVLLSGTMRGFREGCIPSLREHIVQPNSQHGVAIYLATYTESDCGKKVSSMRREGALTGVSLRDGVTVLPIKSLRASDINATYLRYAATPSCDHTDPITLRADGPEPDPCQVRRRARSAADRPVPCSGGARAATQAPGSGEDDCGCSRPLPLAGPLPLAVPLAR